MNIVKLQVGPAILFAVVVTLTAYCSAFQIPTTGPVVQETEPIELAMLRIMADTGYSSATIAVTKNGRLVMSRGYGWQDANRTAPIHPATRMRIASIDKCFGNVAAKTLIRESKLRPDTPVFQYLGTKPYNGSVPDPRVFEITLQNLMDHKLGWDKDHDGFAGKTKLLVREVFRTDSPNMDQINAFMVAQPLQFPPGTESVYSNYGSVVIRRVVERAVGRPYLQYLYGLCDDVGVEIQPSLPVVQRAFQEIHYRPETPPYHDCFTISAPGLCRFFHHYWISGESRDGKNGYVYAFYGSLPGTSSVIRQRPDGVNFAVLFNERDRISNDELDKRIDEAVDLVTKWPDIDLFDQGPKDEETTASTDKRNKDTEEDASKTIAKSETEMHHAFRIWTDDTGQHQIEARFVKAENRKIWLEKRDGTRVDIPVERISQKDRSWVESQLRKKTRGR